MRGAVGEVEVAVVVEVADVAERAPAPLVERARGLLRVVVVLERARRTRTRSGRPRPPAVRYRPRRRCASPPMQRAADGAGMGQPLLRADRAEAVALAARVVLVDDRAPPVEHLLLGLDRARCGGVDDGLRGSTGRSDRGRSSGELEHADEVGRHELGVRDPVTLDQLRASARRRSVPSPRRSPRGAGRSSTSRTVPRGRAGRDRGRRNLR